MKMFFTRDHLLTLRSTIPYINLYNKPSPAQVVCTGFLNIWQARNNLVFKNAVPNPQQVAHITMESVLEWQVVSKAPSNRPNEISMGNNASSSWFVQTDAGCFDNGIVSLGCVIKDPNDKVLTAACQRISSFVDIATAKIMGILWAMHIALDHKLENVIFQSDALEVIDCINGVSYSAALELLVNDCRLMLSKFRNPVVVYLNRRFNIDAHHLVHVGKRLGTMSWSGEIPSVEEPVVCTANLASLVI